MKVIRTAFIGCGRISDLHILGYQDREDADVIAVCDSNLKIAQKKAKLWGIDKVYTKYEDVLQDPEINLIELLVPHHLHASMTIAACRSGKHVSVQKPMALNIKEANMMIMAANQAGVQLRIYENFVFYPPNVIAKEMIDSGEIGVPQMIRVHVGTGKSKTAWKVPLSAWKWRFDDENLSGGVLVFDHGYHLFSLIYHLMGQAERVYAWIDSSPVGGIIPTSVAKVDAPATIMIQFKDPKKYGLLDFVHTPNMIMDSIYYADDDRVEIIGDKGILFINRCTARTVNLPEVMIFKDGRTRAINVDRVEWHDSFIDCTHHFLDVLQNDGIPTLDGETGKAVLQFTLAAHLSAQEKREVRPDDVT